MGETDFNAYPTRAAGYRSTRYPGFAGGAIDPATGNLVNPSSAQISSGLSTFRAEDQPTTRGPALPELPKPEGGSSLTDSLIGSAATGAATTVGKTAGKLIQEGRPIGESLGAGVQEVGNQVSEFIGFDGIASPTAGAATGGANAFATAGSAPVGAVEFAGTLPPPAYSAPVGSVTSAAIPPVGFQSAAATPVTSAPLGAVGSEAGSAAAGGFQNAAFSGGGEVAGAASGGGGLGAGPAAAPAESFGAAASGSSSAASAGSDAAAGEVSSGFSGGSALGAGFGAGLATAAIGLLTGQRPAKAIASGLGAGIGAAVGSVFGPVGTFVGSYIGGAIGGRVVCTELERRGLMSPALLADDLKFSVTLDERTIKGYHRWAPTVVRWMRRDDWFGRLTVAVALRLATWRAFEVSYVLGNRERGDIRGKLIRAIGERWCTWLGRSVEEEYDWTGLFIEELHPDIT